MSDECDKDLTVEEFSLNMCPQVLPPKNQSEAHFAEYTAEKTTTTYDRLGDTQPREEKRHKDSAGVWFIHSGAQLGVGCDASQ